MNVDRYLAQRGTLPFADLSLGYRGVEVVSPEDLTAAQVGYRVAADGTPLTGLVPGDWRDEWLVIGRARPTDDPIFIDTADGALSVYTAAHGEGAWETRLVASSFRQFVAALGLIRDIAAGRENPTALDQNPIPMATRDRILDAIRRQDPMADREYWDDWFAHE